MLGGVNQFDSDAGSVVITADDRAQELHLCIEHIICDVVERSL